MSDTHLANAPEARTATGELKDQTIQTSTTTADGSEKVQTPGSQEQPTDKTKVEPAKVEAKPDPKAKEPSLLSEKVDGEKGPPEKYEFKLPDGFVLEGDNEKEVTGLFKELGLTNAAGQKLMDHYVKSLTAAMEAPINTVKEQTKEWQDAVKADPEIGSRLPEIKQTVSRAIDSLGPELAKGFREAMDHTGAGNHPAFIKAFYKLAQQVTEGKSVTGRGPSGFGQQAPGSKPANAANAMYPNLP